jgi:hypothetical protein
MNRRRNVCLILLIAVCLAATNAAIGQEVSQEFALPNARQGEPYRIEIESVLREKYRLRLESDRNAIILWSIVSGELPAGLTVQTNGTINGVVNEPQAGVYHFRVKAVDVNIKEEALELQCSIELQARRLRLSRIEGPRLVPAVATTTGDNGISGSNHARGATGPPPRETTPEPEPEPATPAPAPDVEVKRAADAEDFKSPFSSLNKRFIIGFEQSGGASAESKGQPFMDLFINTPLSTATDEPARFSVWGDVRLTSTPTQVAAFSNLGSDAIGTLTSDETNEFVSGFDFVVGPEIRLKRFKNTDLSFIAGFGAVSPLNPRKSVQIFEVPKEDSSQREPFLELFPGAEGKEFIAFISPDRDRFLRQYFGGIRLKTYTYDNTNSRGVRVANAAEEIQNVFPAMLDITFGQSEAVTGGKLVKFVLGIDGFYPLPFPDKYRFLYLFGTAKFKVGGPKTISKPLILDTAASSVNVTDSTVFIADPISSNRDFYRIGFGVDLLELFRKKKN